MFSSFIFTSLNSDLSQIAGLKFYHNTVSSGIPISLEIPSFALICISRAATNECAIYNVDYLSPNNVILVTGSAPQYATISNNNKTVIITATAARDYFVTIFYIW